MQCGAGVSPIFSLPSWLVLEEAQGFRKWPFLPAVASGCSSHPSSIVSHPKDYPVFYLPFQCCCGSAVSMTSSLEWFEGVVVSWASSLNPGVTLLPGIAISEDPAWSSALQGVPGKSHQSLLKDRWEDRAETQESQIRETASEDKEHIDFLMINLERNEG